MTRGRFAFLEAGAVFLFKKRRWPFGQLRGLEHRVHAVVITRRQRVELVIVTLETAHRGAEKRLSHGVDDVIQINLPRLRFLHHRRIPRTHAQERTSHQLLRLARVVQLAVLACVLKLVPVRNATAQRRVGQFVAGDLFADKFVVRLVFVEGADDVVAVAPHVGALVVVGVTAGVRVARHVQPMLPPALAVMRTGQQAINERRPRLDRVLVPSLAELENLKRSRRQAREVIIRPLHQRAKIRLRRPRKSRRLELAVDEGIHRIRRALRHLRLYHRLKCPNILRPVAPVCPVFRCPAAGFHQHALGRHRLGAFLGDVTRLRLRIRPRCAQVDPSLEQRQLIRRQLVILLGRHRRPILLMLPRRRQIQWTGQRLARHQRSFLTLSALEHRRPRGQIQIPFQLLPRLAMARQTFCIENPPHLQRKQPLAFAVGCRQAGCSQPN